MKRFLFPTVLCLGLYFALFGGEYSVFEVRKARSELLEREAVLPVVRQQIDSLRARVDSLEHDDEALERFGRERYGLVREGEYLYRLSQPDTTDKGDTRADPRGN